MDLEVLGRVLRQQRERRGLSQEALAELADLSRSYIGEIERGSTIPSIVTLSQLAGAFGVPLSQLIKDYELAAASI